MLAAQSKRLVVLADKPGDYQVASATLKDRTGRPLYIAGVKTGKNYVSYHVMPIYMKPELLKNVPVGLKKRMQGKACFNFKEPDPVLIAELAELTKSGAEWFDTVDWANFKYPTK